MALYLILALFLPAFAVVFLPFVPNKLFGPISFLATFASFLLIGTEWYAFENGEPLLFDIPFAPSLGINFSLLVDGLSLFFGLLVTFVGTLVALYAHYYMHRDDNKLINFWVFLNLFTTAMLGALFSDNLIFLFLFWEMTAIFSFLLIAWRFEDDKAIASGKLSLLATSLSSLFLLTGILLIAILDGTFRWSDIVTQGIAAGRHPYWNYAILLSFLIAIFGKSAQFPFHFWLPKAMTAPTPASAYLHAAAMVNLGIYLTARMFPLFVTSPIWFSASVPVCFFTMILGACLSLLSYNLKEILAWATVSQLGFFIGFYGLSDNEGVSYDFVHILNHALYKGSLFMLVGIIDHATKIQNIRRLGGLWKKMPATCIIFLLAASAMAGVPGTTGFLSKELILSDLVALGRSQDSGYFVLILLVFASIFKVAFSLRLFFHIFVREKQEDLGKIHKPQWQILIAPAILAAFAFGFGLWPQGLQNLAQSFYVSGLHAQDPKNLLLWHGWTIEALISLGIFFSGTLLFIGAEKTHLWWVQHPIPDFAHGWEKLMEGLLASSKALTKAFTGSAFSRHIALFTLSFSLPFLLLDGTFAPPSLQELFLPLLIALTTLPILFYKESLSAIVLVAASGFSVTFLFVLFQAPDLAITQILVEIATGVMLLIVAKGMTRDLNNLWARIATSGLFGAAMGWAALSFYQGGKSSLLKDYFLKASYPLAKGYNAVNTILVDFRGFDTLGEALVLLVSALTILNLYKEEKKPIALIGSPLLESAVPYIAAFLNILAFWLLLTGHNSPGGGFSAGLLSAISLVVLAMTKQISAIEKLYNVKAHALLATGMALLMVSLVFNANSGIFLFQSSNPLNTTLVFDAGVFFIVLAMTVLGIFSLRQKILGGTK